MFIKSGATDKNLDKEANSLLTAILSAWKYWRAGCLFLNKFFGLEPFLMISTNSKVVVIGVFFLLELFY